MGRQAYVSMALIADITGQTWMAQARCVGVDPELFFDGRAILDQVEAICLSCPVCVPCREWAIDHDEHGYWGATTETERARIRRKRNPPTPPITRPICGSLHGLRTHTANNEKPCTPCLTAVRALNAAAARASRQRRKEAPAS